MAPTPAAICGTRAPTAKKRVATAMPKWPVAESRAMIDQVILLELSSGRVALHAAGIGGGAAAAAEFRGGGKAAFRPVGADFHLMAPRAQLLHGGLRHARFDHHDAGTGLARPERRREMLRMPGRCVDRLLQIHFCVDVPQEKLGNPLILLVAAGRTPGEIRLAFA